MTSSLLWAISALSAVTLASAVVQTREGWDPLLGRRRRRFRVGAASHVA